MSLLDDIFTFFTGPVPDAQPRQLSATLTSTSLPLAGSLSAADNQVDVTYTPSTTERLGNQAIQTAASLKFALPIKDATNITGTASGSVTVTVNQNHDTLVPPRSPAPRYTMEAVFPWGTMQATANVDAASGGLRLARRPVRHVGYERVMGLTRADMTAARPTPKF